MMPDKFYIRFIRIFYALAVFNGGLVIINGFRLYTEFNGSIGSTVFLVCLVCMNILATAFTIHRARAMQKERKDNMWKILNQPENYIW